MTSDQAAVDQFLGEILQQPAALRSAAAALARQQAQLAAVDRLARDAASGPVLTGMGSSHDVSLAAASVLARRGVRATTVNTAELLHFRMGALNGSAPLVAISQSGRSAELVRLARELAARGGGPPLISVTNGLDNPLAELADVALDTAGGEEVGPSTKTFGACIVTLRALVDALSPGAEPLDAAALCARVAVETERAALAAETLLARATALAAEMREWCAGRRSLVILGRGTARAAAEMGALILKEAAQRHAESLDTAEFRHGPLELAGPGLAAVIVSSERATEQLDAGLAVELRHAGAATLLITTSPTVAQSVPGALAVGELDPLIAAAVEVIPLQLLAWQLAVDGGREPGRFTQASKVTTRE